jgi:hypothetical protein
VDIFIEPEVQPFVVTDEMKNIIKDGLTLVPAGDYYSHVLVYREDTALGWEYHPVKNYTAGQDLRDELGISLDDSKIVAIISL